MSDIRDILFKKIASRKFVALLIPETNGVVCGLEKAAEIACVLGVHWCTGLQDGNAVSAGIPFAKIVAEPKLIAMAEEQLIGALSKTSGIATAAARAVAIAEGHIKIVSGAWKKMPPEMKEDVRRAVSAGGVSFRIASPPMVYIDKNFIRMLGSVEEALKAASELEGTKVIQIRGETVSVEEETLQAISGGADILMVDTGKRKDLQRCVSALTAYGVRDRHKVAFSGNLTFSDIPELAALGVDVLDIGKAIIDAPLLDMRLDVAGEV